jgi:hypothetical protein
MLESLVKPPREDQIKLPILFVVAIVLGQMRGLGLTNLEEPVRRQHQVNRLVSGYVRL